MLRPHRPRRGDPSRRAVLAGVVAATAGVPLVACAAPGEVGLSTRLSPRRPSRPISFTVLDGSGDLSGGDAAILANFAKANADIVKDVQVESAGAPNVIGKIRSEAIGGQVSTSLVLGGTDVLGSVQDGKLAQPLLPSRAADLPDLDRLLDAPRRQFQQLASGQGVLNTWGPAGPLLEYDSSALPDPPRTPEALLAWVRAHPGKFSYAAPNNSGPGRTFLMGIPYLLHDHDPTDPVRGWSRTWAYLTELGKDIASYPSSTSLLNQQLADGTLQLVTTQPSFDVSQHQNATFGPAIRPLAFEDPQWVSDGHFMIVPRGVSPEAYYVALAFMRYLYQPQQQVHAFDMGGLTSVLPSVTPAQATPAGKKVIASFGRQSFYTRAFGTGEIHPPLRPDRLLEAFEMWQRKVGSRVGS